MEAQETPSSETHLDFAVLPDVPFLRVLSYLSGPQIEKCRGISRLFQERIDLNRKSLPTIQVESLTIDQKKVNHELLTSDHNEDEPTVFIAIRNKGGAWRRKYGAAPLRQALERLNQMFPRMSIEDLFLELEYFDDTTFHQLLKKFEDCKVKCQNLWMATEGQKFDWKDLRRILLQLEPEKFTFMGGNALLTSSFWQEKCIRDRRELWIASFNLSFDDQVLLNFPCPKFMLEWGLTACTFDGIASLLNEWKVGTREVTQINLCVLSDLNIRTFFAMLSWNVEIKIEAHKDCFEYSAVLINSLGKKLDLWIEEYKGTKEFRFEMFDDDCDGGWDFRLWKFNDDQEEFYEERQFGRLRLRKAVSSSPNCRLRKFLVEEILETWPIKELLS